MSTHSLRTTALGETTVLASYSCCAKCLTLEELEIRKKKKNFPCCRCGYESCGVGGLFSALAPNGVFLCWCQSMQSTMINQCFCSHLPLSNTSLPSSPLSPVTISIAGPTPPLSSPQGTSIYLCIPQKLCFEHICCTGLRATLVNSF